MRVHLRVLATGLCLTAIFTAELATAQWVMLARRAVGRVEQMSQQSPQQGGPSYDSAAVILEAPADKVYAHFLRFEKELLSRWGMMIALESAIGLSYGLVRRLTKRWIPDAPDWLEVAVIGGMDGIESLATPDTHPLVALLAASAERLRWAQTYTRDDFESRFLDRYGWSELIGLRGPFASDSIAVGFLLLGPDVEYPPHHHAAEEVYYPLAGRAHWQHGDQQFVIRAPGECIHHAPRTPHAMKTGSEPLLALYAWRGGDLAEKSTLRRPSSRR